MWAFVSWQEAAQASGWTWDIGEGDCDEGWLILTLEKAPFQSAYKTKDIFLFRFVVLLHINITHFPKINEFASISKYYGV